MRPVADEFPVSQEFGSDATQGVAANSNPNSGTGYLVYLYGNYQPYGHAGQDIACPIGTPVHAIADGTVIWADWGTNLPGDDSDWGYRRRWYMYKSFPGIVTLIQHDGWISMYGHLSSNDAAPVGTVVTEGQLIGLSGNTKAPGVTLGAHLHVGALVDLSYSCSNGLIYGCTDPTPFYGAISAQSTTITPLEEYVPLTKEEVDWIAGRVAEVIQPMHDVTRSFIPAAVWDVPIPYRDPVTGALTKQTTTGKTVLGFTDFQHNATRTYLPPAVLNQQFSLPDGTVTNLAGILSAIHAQPVTVTGPTADAAAIAQAIANTLSLQFTTK